ncbi:MAG: EscR/YscR/HrcR family type III secretion system export apparatus protein [Deltaproteobacteria bacterium]|nr:EscR/YscR/HrcR family type III secretion system export apparatus protein [Deltaproteobacteria bacterium]
MAFVVAQAGGTFSGVSPLVLSLLLGVAAVLPFVLLVGTSFVKVSVVLGLVRNALGTQQVPGNMVVMGLAAILSLHIMAPTGAAVAEAAGPLAARALASDLSSPDGVDALGRAWDAARAPIARFLRANATPRDRALFLDLARQARARDPSRTEAPRADDLSVLLPAFVVSELTRAFSIGFLVFLPFLVVDLVIANILTALGLQSLSASTVATPFKLLLFVLADGWYLLARALVLGYR